MANELVQDVSGMLEIMCRLSHEKDVEIFVNVTKRQGKAIAKGDKKGKGGLICGC